MQVARSSTAASGALLDRRGSRAEDGPAFAPSGVVRLCWEVSHARRPANVSPDVRPGVGFVLIPSGGEAKVWGSGLQQSSGCETVPLMAARYFVRVFSPFNWVEWHYTVQPQ